MAPLVKLGNHYKKVSDFQKRIPNIPRILELDHLTITGNVNLGKNVTLRGTVIIVASNSDTIDIPPGSILENVVSSEEVANDRLSLRAPFAFWSIKIRKLSAWILNNMTLYVQLVRGFVTLGSETFIRDSSFQ